MDKWDVLRDTMTLLTMVTTGTERKTIELLLETMDHIEEDNLNEMAADFEKTRRA